MKKIILVVTFLLVVVFLGRNLNPFEANMFEFHDETQAARLQEFVYNLRSFQIPPRFAPHFSFNLGYPVFNFYAPFSYWVSSLFVLIGFSLPGALKLSFLLALIVGFNGMHFWLKNYFKFYPSLFGAILYVSSLYFALDIFVRGNLGEIWFLALIPWVLHFIYLNARQNLQKIFIRTVFFMCAMLTSHNLLSLLVVPVVLGYILLQPNKKRNIFALAIAFLLGSYFFIPLFFESTLTYATSVAALTRYQDHFVCISQLWHSPWGYGGSTTGCEADGMSFMIGKAQIVFLALGILFYVSHLITKRKIKDNKILLFFLILTLFSFLMTTPFSKPLWDIVSPLSIVQFPWRFLSFTLLGVGFFGAYLLVSIETKLKNVLPFLTLVLVVATLVVNAKYFFRPTISRSNYQNKFLSTNFINQEAAYKIGEYLPKTAEYDHWRSLEKRQQSFQNPAEGKDLVTIKNSPFEKIVSVETPQEVIVNIHYFPFWQMTVEGGLTNSSFDKLGRPRITVERPTTIHVKYEQTLIEQTANLISVVTFFALVSLFHPSIWKKMNHLIT